MNDCQRAGSANRSRQRPAVCERRRSQSASSLVDEVANPSRETSAPRPASTSATATHSYRPVYPSSWKYLDPEVVVEELVVVDVAADEMERAEVPPARRETERRQSQRDVTQPGVADRVSHATSARAGWRGQSRQAGLERDRDLVVGGQGKRSRNRMGTG